MRVFNVQAVCVTKASSCAPMTGGSSGLSSKSLNAPRLRIACDCWKFLMSIRKDLCFSGSGALGLEDKELGVGLRVGFNDRLGEEIGTMAEACRRRG